MELFIDMFVEHFFKMVIVGFFGLLSWIAKKALDTYRQSVESKKEQMQSESSEQLLIKEGVLSLLRYRINRLCVHIQAQERATVDEALDLDDLFTAYKNLGGNSRTHRVYKYIKETYPVQETNKLPM